MKHFFHRALLLLGVSLLSMSSTAQPDNRTVMTIAGEPVSVSEFLYSYKKNNTESVIDKKELKEYVELFVNYKLKVRAALDAHLDTLQSFREEYASYRDPQLIPVVVNDSDVEAEAKKIYEDAKLRTILKGGLIKAAHIMIRVPQQAPNSEAERAKQRIDSIYAALQGGASFEALARQYSQDPGSASKGGELPWAESGQFFKEFEQAVFSQKAGELIAPFQTPAGWHVAKVLERCDFLPYDTLRENIIKYIDRAGIKEQIFKQKVDEQVKESNGKSREEFIQERIAEMKQKDPDLENLLREYHDGLLLFEISNREVWEAVEKDETALANYFAKNKKKYQWDEPRFKGISYQVKDKKDVKAVKKAVKGLPFDQWNEKLRTTFNNDSILRIRVKKGLFKKGEDSLVDREIFKVKKNAEINPEFPINAVYGKLLKGPQTLSDVRKLVVADLQEELEKQWVARLRQKYSVVINEEVLATLEK